MPATAKLYETDPYVQTFTATVLVCTPAGEQFAVQLDRTAFYPEGGGQPCDTGALGTALVTDVQEHGGVITHTVSAALPVGQTVEGRIDWARRRDHMEQHTGEHILSGTLHRLFGAENVGFHIGSPAVRMDMSVPLTAGQLRSRSPGQRGDPCGRPGALLVPRAGRPCKTDLPQQKGN